MSTFDVPGSNPVNKDTLKMGCWAESKDGSLLFVESTEENRVVYYIFDVNHKPPVEFIDALPIKEFEKQFSYKKGKNNKEKWIWHDKTSFPWDRVLKEEIIDGASAASKLAQIRELTGKTVNTDRIKSFMDHTTKKGRSIVDKIQRAINELKV